LRADKGGFCFGVRRAVDTVYKAVEAGGNVYTWGPIIHNAQVVGRLEALGVKTAENADDIPEGSTVVIRSHGVGEQTLKSLEARGVVIVDATCPCVKRIQAKAKQCSAQGIPVIVIGEREHPEVEGIGGWVSGGAFVVNSEEDVAQIPRMRKACVVAQTTTPQPRWDRLTELLREKIEEPEIYPSICGATAERQAEADELARQADCIIVLGGRNSSNTRKLYEICSSACPRTLWVQSAAELPQGGFEDCETTAIISGASTPDWIIEEVCAKMSEMDNKQGEILEDPAAPVQEQAEGSEPAAEQPEGAAQESAPEESGIAAPVEEPAKEEPAAEVAPPPPAIPKNSFEEAFEKTMKPIHSGQVVTGTVVQVNEDEVCVNIGYKADGIITKDEFSSDPSVDLMQEVHEGDELEVEIIKINDGEGNVLLSLKNLEVKRGWKQIMDDFEAGNIIKGMGKQVVKGGLIALIYGVRAFIPASQLDSRYVEDLSEYVNKEMDLKILEVEKHRHRVVASRKAVLENEKQKHESETWEMLKSHENEMTRGVVRRITDFGAFVEVAGVDGLVHVTDLAWGRVKHPRDVVAVGDEIDVVVLKVDVERKRLSLSAKQAKPRPWDLAPEKYHTGEIVQGKVVRIVSFGAFVELEPGLDGLVHISQVADRHVEKVEDVLHPEDIVTVKILDVNPEEKRISLSIREAMAEMAAAGAEESDETEGE
jgi:4-hydroxy-3-methylbut-2-enyl diphosphate reductase